MGLKLTNAFSGFLLLALGAGPALSADAVGITLNYVASGPHAGFMYAKELGYYADAGLDVTITEGRGSANTSQLVATGRSDFGYADAGSALQVRAKGGQVTVVAPILQTNAYAIISLKKTGITSVKDLEGKKVAVQPGSAQTSLLDAIFAANSVDKSKVDLVNISTTALVGSLLQGQVDAILAGADSEAIQLEGRGAEVSELFYRDVGVPTVGLSIIVNDAVLKEKPDVVRRFVAASLKGWAAARDNPQAAVSAIATQFPVGADKDQFLKQLNVDLKFVCAKGAETLGKVPADIWTETAGLLTKYAAFPATPPISTYYSEDYLPASAPTCKE